MPNTGATLAVLLAVLYGRLPGGLVALILSFTWVWYCGLPPHNSFGLKTQDDVFRTLNHGGAALVVLVLTEKFRRLVDKAVERRDAEIARRSLLLEELEHRTKNNFALVVSLLETQKRSESNPAIQRASEIATSRIHSFARAYTNLAESQGEGGAVSVRPYLREVVTHFSDGGFHESVKVSFHSDECSLAREVAVAIGLFTNEALTNCAKYAFADGRAGQVKVRFDCGAHQQWELVVADDGIGEPPAGEDRQQSGLGTKLMAAFAQQARAKYSIDTSERGRTVRLTSA